VKTIAILTAQAGKAEALKALLRAAVGRRLSSRRGPPNAFLLFRILGDLSAAK